MSEHHTAPSPEKPPMLVTLERMEQHLARLDKYIVGTMRWQLFRTVLAVAVQVFWIVLFFLAAWQVKVWSENALAALQRPFTFQEETLQGAKDTLQGWKDSAGSLTEDLFGTPSPPPGQ